jgi:hypothetical protein
VLEYGIPILMLMSPAPLAEQGKRTLPRQTFEQHYACAFGVEFTVRFSGTRAIVLADGQRYELEERPLSVGVRYGSDTVAFAQDDDRAVLVGAAGGPYRDCVQLPPRPLA